MKLGVSYNVFDGEELLEPSIKSIRDSVDFVSVVYQTTSNFGNPANEGLEPMLKSLKEKGLIDELFFYKPNNGEAHQNEVNKRNIGLYLSERERCTHHMSMDTDEFYRSDELDNIKSIMEENDFDSSACQMVTYYKEPIYRLEPKEDYFVSLIFKIRNGIEYKYGHPFPVLVDPTRRMVTDNCRVFNRDEIEMHHMSYIRDDINSKFNNSTARINFDAEINNLINHFNSWEFGNKALVAGKPPKEYDVVEVENIFGI